MGSPMPDDELGGDLGGFDEEPADDKPFDDTPFDAGVEADEDTDPAKYIQQLAGKLGQSLRKHTDQTGQPDFDLEKFAINSVLSATNSSKMDQEDQTDIINKVKSSSTDGAGGNGGADQEPDLEGEDPTMGGEEGGEETPEGGIDLTDIDMEEGHNPNGNSKTVFQDMTMGVKDGGMEENKYLNLENKEKSSIFVDENKTIKNMVKEMLTESPTVLPETKPVVTPTRKPSRKSKPWTIIPEGVPNPEPKADAVSLTYINSGTISDNDVEITFDVGDVRFAETFTNTGEILEKPMAHDEPWVYSYETEPLSNGKRYGVSVSFYGNPTTHLDLDNFTDGDRPEIQEV